MYKWLAVTIFAGMSMAPMAQAESSPREAFFAFQRVLEGASELRDLFPYMSQRVRADLAGFPDTPAISGKVLALMRHMGRIQDCVVVSEAIDGPQADLVVEGTGRDPLARAVRVQTQVVLREESGEWKIERLDSQALGR